VRDPLWPNTFGQSSSDARRLIEHGDGCHHGPTTSTVLASQCWDAPEAAVSAS